MKILDLTLPISDKIPAFPGSPKPNFIQWENLKDDGYNLELLFLSSHTGTHLDAPYHFLENGLKIHEISLTRLVREAVLIMTRKKSSQSITKSDIQNHEKKHGKSFKNGPQFELKSIKNRSKNRCEKRSRKKRPRAWSERHEMVPGSIQFNKIENKLTEKKQIIWLPAEGKC